MTFDRIFHHGGSDMASCSTTTYDAMLFSHGASALGAVLGVHF
jgi:hypothetical protein